MAYCTIQEIRDEGVTADQAIDARVQKMIDLVSAYIDLVTGQWFEPRQQTINVYSLGGPVLYLPVAPVTITAIGLSSTSVPDYDVDSDPANPALIGRNGWVWPEQRVSVTGTFGVLENGQTPALINLAAVRLAIRELPLATDVDGQEQKRRSRVLSETVDGHSYTLAQLVSAEALTGDPEIDGILIRYRRPLAAGVV